MCRKIETVSIYDKPNESNSDFAAYNSSTFHKVQNVLNKLIPKKLNSNLIMPFDIES